MTVAEAYSGHTAVAPSSLARHQAKPWREKHRSALLLTDALAIVSAVAVAQLAGPLSRGSAVALGGGTVGSIGIGLVIAVAWIAVATWPSLRSTRVSPDNREYSRILIGTISTFGVVAVLAYLTDASAFESYFTVALPLGTALLLVGRLSWHLHLTVARKAGRTTTGVVLVGDYASVSRAMREMRGNRPSDYTPIAVSISEGSYAHKADPQLAALPHFQPSELRAVVQDQNVGTVMVAGGLRPNALRELAWDLEGLAVELVLVSGLTDVEGSRTQIGSMDGIPVMHVDIPQRSPVKHFVKRTVDIIIASVVLVLSLPLLLLIVVAIKIDDRGPAIYRQERVGQNGKPFTIHKFRTMATDAESRVDELIQSRGGTALLFKLEHDPRITRVGHFLRKYSLDEFPQFWTVLKGSMSVVGPRPQVAREVAQYEPHMHRRLLTKPGITGLWQIGGRSTLSIEDSMRLDLRYVENWSISGDLVIILKTARAVLDTSNAY